MSKIRAKFRCVRVERNAYSTSLKVTLAPQYDTSIPEDQRYAAATPVGELWMTVDNPHVNFELGAYYYLDFTPVEEGAPT